MDKKRLMELAGVEQKPAKVQQLNEWHAQGMIDDGVIEDAVHDAIWDVLTQLKVKAPEHTVNDAVKSAVHRIQGELDHREGRDEKGNLPIASLQRPAPAGEDDAY